MPHINKLEGSSQTRDVIRAIAIPTGLATISVGAGTAGHFFYLSDVESYSNTSTVVILSEAFFRSLEFLVLGFGEVEIGSLLSYSLLTLGRISATLFVFYAAIAGIGIVFADQLRRLRIDSWSLAGSLPKFDNQGHVLVCGIGDDGYALAEEMLEDGRNVVAIDCNQNDRLENLSDMGAVTFEADARHDRTLIRRARIQFASDVFVTAGSDSINGTIVESIARQTDTNSWSQKLDVTAHINNTRLRRTLHEEVQSVDGIYLRTYSESEGTARELLANNPIDNLSNREQRVHVWIVSWTPLSRSVLDQLLHLMHYPEGIKRQITVFADDPTTVEQEMTALSPGIDPQWWDNESMSSFVDRLFPDISVQSMPVSDMELLSDKSGIYDGLRENDKLTIIVDDTDERSLRALISVWDSKLDELSKTFNLDAHLLYRNSNTANVPDTTSKLKITAYTSFGDGCSIEAVRGDKRDRKAKRLALVYSLLYEEQLLEALPRVEAVPVEGRRNIEQVAQWLESLPQIERDQYADAVWRNLPEYKRESNRHASDHASVKFRMADLFSGDDTVADKQTIRKLAETEHRRWCAEKILDGWEPVPKEKMDQWESNDGQKTLREQRYHADIRSTESLRAEMDGEWEKDVSQIKALFKYPVVLGEE